MAESDLVVAADGINSAVRRHFGDHFRPAVDLRPNHFTWMGSDRPLDAFSFFFRETEHGIFVAHAYQYDPGRSTCVLDTDPETFRRAGLVVMDESASSLFLAFVFSLVLAFLLLFTNLSILRLSLY